MPKINTKYHRHAWEGYETATDDKGTWSQDSGMVKFYKSKPWRKLRQFILSREPLCRSCKKQGKYVSATVVDHIKPIRLGGDRMSEDNLQPLCRSCHNSKTAKESNETNTSGSRRRLKR